VPSSRGQLVRASLPLVRSVVFGTVALLVTLAGHVAAGGPAPDGAGLLLAFAVTVSAYRWLLARTEQSWVVLTAALGLVQWGLHELFVTWSSGSSALSSGWASPVHAAEHAMPMSMPATSIAMSMPTMGRPATGGLSASAAAGGMTMGGAVTMLLVHVGITLLLGVVLRLGEATLWSAARRSLVRCRQPFLELWSAMTRSLCVAGDDVAGPRPAGPLPPPDLARRRSRWATAERARRGPPGALLAIA
jgi:hypothetical protein